MEANMETTNLAELVEKRRNCFICDQSKITNVSQFLNGRFDSPQHLTPWSRWQNNPNPKLLVVGQDWSGQESLLKLAQEKADSIAKYGADVKIATNKNLRRLLASIGLDPGTPDAPTNAELYFYNMVLCIKKGNLSQGVSRSISENCAKSFFIHLLRILKPKAIVCLGGTAFDEACRALGKGRQTNLTAHVEAKGQIDCPDYNTAIFGAIHCGGLGTAQRSMELQLQDWQRIGQYINRR